MGSQLLFIDQVARKLGLPCVVFIAIVGSVVHKEMDALHVVAASPCWYVTELVSGSKIVLRSECFPLLCGNVLCLPCQAACVASTNFLQHSVHRAAKKHAAIRCAAMPDLWAAPGKGCPQGHKVVFGVSIRVC